MPTRRYRPARDAGQVPKRAIKVGEEQKIITNNEKLTMLWQTLLSLKCNYRERKLDTKAINHFYTELLSLSLEFQIKMGATEEMAICTGCNTLGSQANGTLILYKGLGSHDNPDCKAAVSEMYINAIPLTIEQIDRMRDILLSERRKKAIADGMFYAIEYPDGKTETLKADLCNDFVRNVVTANRGEFEAINGYSRTDAIHALHNATIVSAESV